MNLSFIIPCYRCEKSISFVVSGLIEILKKNNEKSYEILLINDNSPDRTLDVLTRLAKKNKSIRVINLSKNFGQHAAIMAGFHHISGNKIICLDDDGQTPPGEAFKLIDAINEDNDVVFAKYAEKKQSLFRSSGTYLNNLMAQYLINKPKDISITSYFATKRFIVAFHQPVFGSAHRGL